MPVLQLEDSRLMLRRNRETTPPTARLTLHEFERLKCMHCGGAHTHACPRVKAMRFNSQGILIAVEFFEHWDDSGIVWMEDCDEVADEEDSQ